MNVSDGYKLVSYHAAERFVERVLKHDPSLLSKGNRGKKVREEIFLQIKMYVGLSGKFKVPLPDYQGFIALIEDGRVITIMEK